MGFFGDDSDNSPTRGDQLLEEQINQNKAELEAKRQSLFQTRLDIIKGQGGQIWTPSVTGASSRGGNANGGQSPFDMSGALARFWSNAAKATVNSYKSSQQQ